MCSFSLSNPLKCSDTPSLGPSGVALHPYPDWLSRILTHNPIVLTQICWCRAPFHDAQNVLTYPGAGGVLARVCVGESVAPDGACPHGAGEPYGAKKMQETGVGAKGDEFEKYAFERKTQGR